MLQKDRNKETAISIIKAFSQNNGLRIKTWDDASPLGPHISPSAGNQQIVQFRIDTVRSLTFGGLKDKVWLYEAAMFDYWNFGKYDVETQSGKDKLERFLTNQLSDFKSRHTLAARVARKSAVSGL